MFFLKHVTMLTLRGCRGT